MDLYQLGSSPTNMMNYKYFTLLHNSVNVYLQTDSSIFLFEIYSLSVSFHVMFHSTKQVFGYLDHVCNLLFLVFLTTLGGGGMIEIL